ncbi:hypothetical protein VTN77DRAFT_1894 [Rasamsonia byssochlamydoides]|uniref:uncharacterized protein n=1 Tax=Rasamsonia byssochlamydoides TaxID=89139 RepID=UPI003744A63F
MSAPSAPVIPPRPSRSPRAHLDVPSDMPKIPPRPVNRRVDRSVSPLRDSYAPSPLNDPPNGSSLTRTTSHDPPPRPPSVTIPSLGEEGIEYEDLPVASSSEHQHSVKTRNVSSDLKLHAPKPSLPSSSAKARVQAVTRTDSLQAAAAGFGKAPSPSHDELEQRSRSLYSKPNGSRAESSTASTNRRSLHFDDEHGIPEIGQRVPMYPGAGDVQAPSPAPTGSATSHHQRTRSGREILLPPGSYGLHGHGIHTTDKFEKAWYDKHPDELAREEGQYGPAIAPRPDWALSSEDLNRIVRNSAAKGSGLGTSPAVTGTPEEEVGYIASEEYTSRLASPPPSQAAVESPLRKTSFPAAELERTRSAQSAAGSDTGVIHVNDPYHHLHHPDGYAQTPDHASQGPEGDVEHDEPILAADEVRPESAFLHPAISPTIDRRDYLDLERVRSRTPSAAGSRPASRAASRPGSRPSSLYGAPAGLSRWNSRGEEREDTHAPLADVEEYEPLFPDDEKSAKPVSTAERFKNRTEHRFPSQDIWEDTPDSLQLHASVSTPEPPRDESESKFETLEAEEARRKQTEQIDSHKVASHGETHEGGPSRLDTIKQRFPSRDIWEDAPESQKLVTTIEPSDPEVKSPPDASAKPAIPPRPSIPIRPQRPAKADLSSKNASPEEKGSSPTEVRKAPAIPDRPKPQIPARPSKPITRDSPENGAPVPAPATKPKPTIPTRPNGGRIAGLKADFLSNLNSRLQLGPQGPPKPAEKKEEPEAPAERGPLSDARKGRARGPPRRRPAAAAATETKLPSIPEIRIIDAWNVWQVDADGNLVVGKTMKEKEEREQREQKEQKEQKEQEEQEEKQEKEEKEEKPVTADSTEATLTSSEKESVVEAPTEPDVPSFPTSETTAQADETTSAVPEATSTAKTEDAVEAKPEPVVEPERDEPEAAAVDTESKASSASQETVSEEEQAPSADSKKESDSDAYPEV